MKIRNIRFQDKVFPFRSDEKGFLTIPGEELENMVGAVKLIEDVPAHDRLPQAKFRDVAIGRDSDGRLLYEVIDLTEDNEARHLFEYIGGELRKPYQTL